MAAAALILVAVAFGTEFVEKVLPVDYRTPGTASWRFSLADPHGQMGLFSLYMREMIGLAVYRWTGRAKAL